MSFMVDLVLLLSIPMVVMLFLTQKPHVAAGAASIFGIALLPAARGFDLPLLPSLDHSVLPSLVSMVMLCAVCWPLVGRAKIGRGPEICIFLIMLSAIATNFTNTDAQVFGTRVLSAMQPTDIVNDSLGFLLKWAFPFLVGRIVTRSADDLRDILMILAFAGLLYLPLASLELITGPNLHKWVYGAHPHWYTYSQQIKFGGFRPVVFMVHGLNCASFLFFASCAALILLKLKQRVFGLPILPVTIALMLILIPARTVGVWLYALIAFPLIAFARPRVQVLAAVAIAIGVFAYPVVRSAGVVPVEQLYDVAEEYAGTKAAKSMFARLTTEDEILGRAQERMAFGWGGYARYQLFDPFTGKALSVLDGFWLIQVGEGGVVRLFLIFLFILLPVFSAYRGLGRVKSEAARRMIAGMALVMALRAADLIPNTSSAEGYLTFLCGSLWGAVRGEVKRRVPQRSEAVSTEDSESAAEEDRVPAGAVSGSGSLGMLAAQGPPVRRSRPRLPEGEED